MVMGVQPAPAYAPPRTSTGPINWDQYQQNRGTGPYANGGLPNSGTYGAFGNGMFDALMQQATASAQLAQSQQRQAGVDPALITGEYGLRQQLNNAGYQQNQFAFNDASRQFQGQSYQYKNRDQDLQLQRGQNSAQIQGFKYQQQANRAQQKQQKITAAQNRWDVNSQATAAGAYGAEGRRQRIGTIDQNLAQQLIEMQAGYNGIGMNIRQAQLQDARFQGDRLLNQQMQGLNYGNFLQAGQQFNLANQMTGLNGQLLGNQMQQNLATNANARNNANLDNQQNILNAQNNSYQNILGYLSTIPDGPAKDRMIQELTRGTR